MTDRTIGSPGAAANGAATLPSAAEMRERRRREEDEGYPLELPHDGITVWVRIIDVFDRATIVGLPNAVQRLLLRGVNAQLGIREQQGFDVAGTLDVLDGIDEAADTACLRGFVKPRLVRTQEEANAANDPHVWPLEYVHPRDRKHYFRLVTGQEAEVEAEMLRFRRASLAGLENPRPDGTLPNATVAVRSAGNEGSRLLHMAEVGA